MPIQVFGQGAVQTAYVSYLLIDFITLESDLTLVWPTSYVDVPSTINGVNYNVLAASIDVITDANNIYTITLPDATMASVGANFIIGNIGVSPFNLLISDGTSLVTIPSTALSNFYWIQLIDNSTSAGAWQFINFGAGTSTAQASVLAGTGLKTLSPVLPQTIATLNTNIPVQFKNAPYTVQASDSASLIVWEGDSGIITLPLPPSIVTPGFYVSFNNEGNGQLTINPSGGATIDKEIKLIVNRGQSLTLINDGVDWWSLGLGRDQTATNFIDGTATNPSITFVDDPYTGIYRSGMPFLGFSVSGSQIANISPIGLNMAGGKAITSTDSTSVATTTLSTNLAYSSLKWVNGGAKPEIQLFGSGNTTLRLIGQDTNNLDLIAFTGIAQIKYNNIVAIHISSAGAVTLPTAPLPIGSGGTGAITQPLALNALMPPTPAAGTIIYFNGTDWINLPAGNVNDRLTVTSAGVLGWAP